MNGRARVVLGLAALFAANLSVMTATFWFAEAYGPVNNWAGQVGAGFLFGQVLMLGLWLTLGDGKWYWRLALTCGASMMIAHSLAWGEAMRSAHARPAEDQSAWVVLVLLAILLLSFAALWPVRQLAKWRLSWQDETDRVSSSRQFAIGDLLFWMVPIGGVLAGFRFLTGISGEDANGLFRFILQCLGMVLLSVTALRAAFGRERLALRVGVPVVLTLVLVGTFAGVSFWERFNVSTSTIPWQSRVGPAFWRAVPESLPPLGVAMTVLLNCIALRGLGCHLVWPTQASPQPLEK